MFKKRYQNLFEQMSPNPNLKKNILALARQQNARKKTHRRYVRKPLVAVASVALCFCFVIPTLAAHVQTVYELMYLVSPSAAQFFKPVQKSDTDNGIQLEVVSAYIHDNIAELYVTLQDLEGDRISESTSLYSYLIRRPFDSATGCQRLGYDPESKTATFLITMTEWGGKDITGDKITFSLRQLLSYNKALEEVPIPMDQSQIGEEKAQIVSYHNIRGGSYSPRYEYIAKQKDTVPLLIPGKINPISPTDTFGISAIGFVEGKLHIQMTTEGVIDQDNHGYVYLKDANGNKIDSIYHIAFVNQEEEPGRVDYSEYVFDVSQEELGDYHLYGYFVTSNLFTEGDWQITFPLEQAEE